MPSHSPTGQPEAALAWFRSEAGLAVLESERDLIGEALDARAGQPWLWLAPCLPSPAQPEGGTQGRGLALAARDQGWAGAVACGLPLPLPTESFGVAVLQHVFASASQAVELLAETSRILVPGGRVWLFALNPLSPYRWRWRGTGLRSPEPVTWRRQLRAAGLQPDPVSRGLGPSWRVTASPRLQHGPGVRAAYVIRAEKRTFPLTPTPTRRELRLPQGAPAG
jgi:SAM-dependent methyltransferase